MINHEEVLKPKKRRTKHVDRVEYLSDEVKVERVAAKKSHKVRYDQPIIDQSDDA